MIAAATAFEALKWGKRAYTGYKALRAVANKAQSFSRAPAIISETCALCAALLEPLAVAEAMAIRHVSLRIVGPAITLAQDALAQVRARSHTRRTPRATRCTPHAPQRCTLRPPCAPVQCAGGRARRRRLADLAPNGRGCCFKMVSALADSRTLTGGPAGSLRARGAHLPRSAA